MTGVPCLINHKTAILSASVNATGFDLDTGTHVHEFS